MSSYFRSRRGIHHMMIVRIFDLVWNFFWHSSLSLKLVFLGAVCVAIGLVLPWARIPTPITINAFSFVAG
ncbi:MAG: hypothetical protein WCK88_03035 [bacterium]